MRKNISSEMKSNPDTPLKSKGTNLRFEIYVFVLCILYIYIRTNTVSKSPHLTVLLWNLSWHKSFDHLFTQVLSSLWRNGRVESCSSLTNPVVSATWHQSSIHPLPLPACLKVPAQTGGHCKLTQQGVILGRLRRNDKHIPPIFLHTTWSSFLGHLL